LTAVYTWAALCEADGMYVCVRAGAATGTVERPEGLAPLRAGDVGAGWEACGLRAGAPEPGILDRYSKRAFIVVDACALIVVFSGFCVRCLP
jgi:hypothetical protein